jgi:PAS domain S-box-containing protein
MTVARRWFRLTGSLQSRLMLSLSVLVVTLMAIVSAVVNSRLASLLLRETRSRGMAVAHSIGATTENALLNYDYLSLRQATEKALREEEIAYVVVLDKEDGVAALSAQPSFPEEHVPSDAPGVLGPERPYELRFLEVGKGDDRRRILDVTYGVFLEGSDVRWGAVGVGLDLESMHQAIGRVRAMLMAIGVAAMLLAVIGSRIIARRLTASIDELVHGTIAVSRGDLDHRIEARTDDEIATLAAHFNHMTAQVKKQQNEIAIAKRELEILNATLEEKVARRTQELLSSEEKYRTLVDSSPDPILIVQGERIRFVNPAFERIFGLRTDGADGGPRAPDIFHPDDRERTRYFLEHVLGGEVAEAGEVRGVTGSGEVRVFEMRGMRINYLGEPAAEILLMDMTERKELQDHLLQHEKLRALGELAGGVAHDFNNILGIILGRSQLLQRVVTDEEVRRGLRTIERAAFDGGETVRRIQDFARARTERNFENLNLNTLLEETVEITRTRWKDQAEVRDVRIDVEMELEDVPDIRGNASELREVYTNLVFNAVDAMPTGGKIVIRTRTEDGDAVVEVRDDGIGMTDDVCARIFDPFFTTKGTNGMGLGMSVVFGIVQRHKGRISVESRPGEGTCFRLRFPGVSAEARPDERDAAPAAERPARILVIDDEDDIAELVTDILEAAGHAVRSAPSGPEGLRLLETESFDVLFCDLGMREMSGWEVVKAVRAKDPAMGIALLTGWGATLSEEKVAEHGIDAVLNKPFEMKRLLETVARLLEVRRGATA